MNGKRKHAGALRAVSLLLCVLLLACLTPESRASEKVLELTPGRYVRWRRGLPPQDGKWYRILISDTHTLTDDYFVCGNTVRNSIGHDEEDAELYITEEQGAMQKVLPGFDAGSDMNFTLHYFHTPAARFVRMDGKNNHDSPAPMYEIRLADWTGNDGNLTDVGLVPEEGRYEGRFTNKQSVPWAFVGYEHDDDVDKNKYVIEQFRTGGIGGASWHWHIGPLAGQKSAVAYAEMDSWMMAPEFYVYYGDEIAVDTISDGQTVEDGEIVNIAGNSYLTLAQGSSLTVKDGGILSIDGGLYNDGTIRVEKGGTLIVREKAFIMPGQLGAKLGSVVCDGGDVIIYSGGKVVCEGPSGFKFSGGDRRYGTVYNYGAIITTGLTAVGKARSFHNEGSVMLGYQISAQLSQSFQDSAVTIAGGRASVTGLKSGVINTDRVSEGVITGNGVVR